MSTETETTLVPVCSECECERTLVLDDDMSICCRKCGAVFDLEELPDLYAEEGDDDDPDEDEAVGDGDPRGDLDEDEVSASIHSRRGLGRGE